MKKIKIGDTIKIIQGKEKGKTGIIQSLLHKQKKVIIKGINTKFKHLKPTSTKVGKILKFSAALDISNVMLLDKMKIVSRVGFTILNGKKYRILKKTKNLIL